ncbi:MAG: BatA domain-containing protein [Candidatus Poribacteria bacterium]
MNFLNPIALYLLFLISIIVLLYFLKLKRKRYVVPSVIFWLQAVEDMRANVPFARWRKNLLLPLQILFMLIVILGLARPAWKMRSQLGKHTILVIDSSASMQAIDHGQPPHSRFEAAKTAAAEIADSLGEGEQVMFIEADAKPTIKATFTADKLKLRDVISALRVTDAAAELKSALELAISTAKGLEGSEIIVLSDNAIKLPAVVGTGVEPLIQFLTFGKRNLNVAITQFNVTKDDNDSTKYQVFVELRNFSEIMLRPFVYLSIEGHNIAGDSVNLQPGERKGVTLSFDDKGFDMQTLMVELDVKDDLKVDNFAYTILHKAEKLKVLLVSDERNRYLQNALLTNPNVHLRQLKPNQYLGAASDDITIFYNTVPKEMPEGNVIFINPKSGLPFMPVAIEKGPISVVSQNENHPVMRFVDLTNLEVRIALEYDLPNWGIPLVETTASPLIWLGEQLDRKGIVFSFDAFNLKTSKFALSYACPILLANCLSWLGPAFRPISPDNVKAGTPVTINLSHPQETEQVTIKSPDGNIFPLDVSKNLSGKGSLVFTNTEMTGIYEVFADDVLMGKFAVNLLDERESNIMPQTPERQEEGEISATTSNITYKELWGRFILLGLFILVAEWWVYHRRV